jgi:epidermal growth factor receptor substrate 15
VKDDFDAAFAGFGEGQQAADTTEDPFAPSGSQARGFNNEFPPIQTFEGDEEDDSSSDEDEEPAGKGAFDDDFATATAQTQNDASSFLAAPAAAVEDEVVTTPLPDITKQTSPPSYDQSNDPAHGGSGDRTGSNQFPPEFGGLLPSREDPTSPPPPATSPPEEVQTPTAGTATAEAFQLPERSSSLQVNSAASPGAQTVTTPTTDSFFDASSRPISTATDAPPPPDAPKNAFDDFDDFNDLSEAKEADKTGELDFGFGRQSTDDFNPVFDSPAQSQAATPVPAARSVQQSQDLSSSGNGFANFAPNVTSSETASSGNGNGSIQQTPQNVQHDWDAIFSGLDSGKGVDTSFGNGSSSTDPWASVNGNGSAAAATTTTAAPVAQDEIQYQPPPGPPPSHSKPDRGGAITPGTEHDDPILKRLTGMGYARKDALTALEMYDYDINKVCSTWQEVCGAC